MREELIALAERVEALSGPDREVDRAIVESVRGKPKLGFQHGRIDHYTASLDAAMSLVPDGYDWIVGHTNAGLTVYAECGGTGGDFTRFAATPALALTAAALRARAEVQP
jgi:hypothetical protein